MVSRRSFGSIVLAVMTSVSIAGCAGTNSQSDNSTNSRKNRKSASGTTQVSPSSSVASTRRSTTLSQPTLNLHNKRVSRGKSGYIVIEAKNVQGVGLPAPFGFTPSTTTTTGPKTPTLNFEKVISKPQVYEISLSYPPEYRWKSIQETVLIKIPYKIPQKTQSKTYFYDVTAWQNSDERQSTTISRSASITVNYSTTNR